jgi:AraC-like DNA-binding protein
MADLTLDPALTNRSDGPVIIVAAGSQETVRSSGAHSHCRGQLFGSMRGLITVGVDEGVWVVPTTHAIWVPPHRVHWARSHGPFQGFAIYVAEPDCATLPAAPCSIRMSGLLRIARALADDPADDRTLEDWARWAAIGARSLSRHFVAETGFTFTVWRQRARLLRALEMLADAVPVTRIALDLGYSTPSTFIDLFRRTFGATPAAYRQRFVAA